MYLLQWFLDRMADDDWWPMQILIKCPNQIVRQVRKKFLSKSGDCLTCDQKQPILMAVILTVSVNTCNCLKIFGHGSITV